MQSIPDTGGGLAGFFAHWLWTAYRYFPSPGHYDWILLFLSISVLTHLLFLPHLWKSVEADMKILKKGVAAENTGSNQDIWTSLWSLGCLFFFIWFFHTPAGLTFVQDRRFLDLPLNETSRGLFFFCLAITVVSTIIHSSIVDKAKKMITVSNPTSPYPFPRRNFTSLYGGGGVFVRSVKGTAKVDEPCSIGLLYGVFTFVTLSIYWYWADTSLILMLLFLLSTESLDLLRSCFVFILHRKTFG